jgi:hypothetical protein
MSATAAPPTTRVRLVPDCDFKRIYMTSEFGSGNVLDCLSGDQFPLEGGVQMLWPGGLPATGSKFGTLRSTDHVYILRRSLDDTEPTTFLADPVDVTELTRLGAVRAS